MKEQTFEDSIKKLTPELYDTFKQALELSKWPNGTVLSKEQKQHVMQAIIAYERINNVATQEQTGYLPSKQELREQFTQPVKIK